MPNSFSGRSIASRRSSRVSRGTRYWLRLKASASPVNSEQRPRNSDRIVTTT